MTTKLRITIDRGPNAKREECGVCDYKSFTYEGQGPHRAVCDVFSCKVSADWINIPAMRCEPCLAAEREAEG